MNELKGLGVAMITPFTKAGEVDVPALKKLTDHLVTGGADYLVVMGTTGESATLSAAERQEVLDRVIAVNKDRKPEQPKE